MKEKSVLVAAVIWLAIGAAFGWVRARARYWQRLLECSRGRNSYKYARSDALEEAAYEFIKWTLLGALSAFCFLAWILSVVAADYRGNGEKAEMTDALFASLAVFVLGKLALDRNTIEWRQMERLMGREKAVATVIRCFDDPADWN